MIPYFTILAFNLMNYLFELFNPKKFISNSNLTGEVWFIFNSFNIYYIMGWGIPMIIIIL